MKVFWPFRTKWSPSLRATVRMEPNASDPAPGSVIPQAPIFSPVNIGSAYFCFCANVPLDAIAPPASPIDAPKASVKPGL